MTIKQEQCISGDGDRASQYETGDFIVITHQNVKSVEKALKEMTPRTEKTDKLLFRYFDFILNDLKKINKPFNFPFSFYIYVIQNEQHLQTVLMEISTVGLEIVKARGRGHYGRIGDYFWQTSEVEGMLEKFNEFGQEFNRVHSLLTKP